MSKAYIQAWCEYILSCGERDDKKEGLYQSSNTTVTVPISDKFLGSFVCKELNGKQQPLKMSFDYDALQAWYNEHSDDTMSWTFVMGLFDACGDISYVHDWKSGLSHASCSFTVVNNKNANELLEKVAHFCGVPGKIVQEDRSVYLEFQESNCLDVLIPMYTCMDKQYFHSRLYEKFARYITDRPPQPMGCKIWRTTEEAIVPSKAKPSDVGYDLSVIKKVKDMTNTCTLYDTCIRVQCPFGMYAEVVPRSSLSKSGYMLANSVGIIDPSYTGNIMIALVKVDQNAPDITLPFRCCQLIFRKQEFVDIIDVTTSEEDQIVTSRNIGGFGSSG